MHKSLAEDVCSSISSGLSRGDKNSPTFLVLHPVMSNDENFADWHT
jgi:hypothetical protein